MMNVRQPAIYLPHGGGPWPFMDDPGGLYTSLRAYLRDLPDSLPQAPAAIVLVTAHWEEPEFTIASGQAPELIYDYGGFPDHTYGVKYPAPGDPTVAARLADLAAAAGIEARLDERHGWDHGVFVPLAVSWPDAEVPVVAVSLKRGLDPAEHVAFGSAIAAIRDENVVVIGSGLSIHDLSFRISPQVAASFDEWLERAMLSSAHERAERVEQWSTAPGGRAAHPREEHLLPLMTVVGAADGDRARRSFSDDLFGLKTAGYAFEASSE